MSLSLEQIVTFGARQRDTGESSQCRRDVAHIDAIDCAATRNAVSCDEERRIHVGQLTQQAVRPGRRVRLDECAGDPRGNGEPWFDPHDERGVRKPAFASGFLVVELAENTARRVGDQCVEHLTGGAKRCSISAVLQHDGVAPCHRPPVEHMAFHVHVDEASALERNVH